MVERSSSILVTGATGFIGARLIPVLAAAFPGRAITALGREAPPEGLPDGVSGGVIELDDPANIRTVIAMTKPGVVIHLAGQASVASAGASPWPSWRDNMFGAVALAEAVREQAPGGAFLFASTAEVYGRAFASGETLDETAPLQPANPYARGKAAAEYALQDLFAGTGTRLVNLRIFNHLGAGQGERFVASAFAAQLARIEAGLAAPVMRTGNLEVERDFGNVADLLDAFAAVVRVEAQSPSLSTFNVSSGRARPVREILDRLIALSTAQPTVETDPALVRPGEMQRITGSHAALTKSTGWTPRHGLEPALTDVMTWWRDTVSKG